MTTRLTFLTHAATSATRRAAFPDDEPVEEGAAPEMAEAAERLGATARASCSPALAARQTAAALGLAASVDPELRDCDHGRWRGRPLAEVQAAEPAMIARWIADPDFDGHGGESIARLLGRMEAWLARRGAEGGRIVAVTHAAVIRAAAVAAIGAPAASFWRIDIAPLTIVELRGGAGRWTLRRIETQHQGGARRAAGT